MLVLLLLDFGFDHEIIPSAEAVRGITSIFSCGGYQRFLPGTLEKGAGGSRHPSCLSVGGAGGVKVPFLNAMICFLIVNMMQRRSYKLKASNT